MTPTGQTRPVGIAPGALSFLAALIVAGMIARLTGTPVILALMAALVITVAADAIAGGLAARRTHVRSMTTPTTITTETIGTIRVELQATAATAQGMARNGRLRLTDTRSTTELCRTTIQPADLAVGAIDLDARFHDAGIVRSITTHLEYGGPIGLVWWRHTTKHPVDPIHVAPASVGPLVEDLTRSTNAIDGPAAGEHGNHLGDIDGVRTFREGDPVGAIHWPSSLRAGGLIVHDRAATADQRWVVDLDAVVALPDEAAAGRVRHTLDEGIRLGHDVAVVHGGEQQQVGTLDAAADWSALVADTRRSDVEVVPVWRRPLRLVNPSTGETPTDAGAGTTERPLDDGTTVRVPARWFAAIAAGASLAMLIGGLSRTALFTAATIIGVVLGAVVSLHLSGRRPRLLQAAIVGVIVVALGVIAADASGVGGLLDALRGPLPNLLVLLVVLHGFEVTDRRTLRVHQAFTFVVAAYATGLRIDDALAWWVAAWGVALLASMLLTDRVARGASARTAARGTRSRAVGRSIAWTGVAIAATLALLSVIPIPDGPARLGLPALSTNDSPIDSPGALAAPGGSTTPAPNGGDRGTIGGVVGYPGFTDTLDTTIRGDLGDQVVMRVRAPEPAFWRGQTFSDFDGRVWTASDDDGERQDGPTIDVEPSLGDGAADGIPTEEFVQTYFIETDLPNVVFAAARPTQVIFDGALWTRPDGALRSDVTLAPGSVYTVVSERPQVTGELLRSQGDLGAFFSAFRGQPGAEALDPWLEVPASTTDRTIALAEQLRQPTTYDTVLAYERWLGANTQYDLDAPVPADGADAVDDFLFESRLGYCEQIASTLAVMLRSQGVPARLATGYIPGERDRVSGVWKVLASDAHSWVEVWFPQTGWQAFDPTASVPLAGDTETGTVGGDLVGAAASSLASHRIQLLGAALLGVTVWLAAGMALRWRSRRRRGRWGVLQDRFSDLDPPGDDARPISRTNPQRAAHFEQHEVAAPLAEALDRAAFDPAWVDDDDAAYRAARSAVATLERQRH